MEVVERNLFDGTTPVHKPWKHHEISHDNQAQGHQTNAQTLQYEDWQHVIWTAGVNVKFT